MESSALCPHGKNSPEFAKTRLVIGPWSSVIPRNETARGVRQWILASCLAGGYKAGLGT